MSVKPFEDFLVEKLRDWLMQRIERGARFQFKSPDPENTLKLLSQLFFERDGTLEFSGQELSHLRLGRIRLLVVGHQEQCDVLQGCYTENYISMLRDRVAAQEGEFENSALLIIHNSLLDTLVNSALNLGGGEAVWSPPVIKGHLESLIEASLSSQVVSRCLLEHQVRMITEDGSSVFGFRHLYEAMVDGDLRFDELGLFNDQMVLNNDDEKQVEHRLERNRQLRAEIEFAVEHYPNELEERLTQFGSKFIQKHFGEGAEVPWPQLDYGAFLEEIEKQKQHFVEFDGFSSLLCQLHQRNKKETASGLREKHVIILMPEDQPCFSFSIQFSGQRIGQRELLLQPKAAAHRIDVEHQASRTRTVFTLSGSCDGNPYFFSARLNRDRSNERYSFHCMVIREGLFHLDPLLNHYLVSRSQNALILQAEELSLSVNPDSTKVRILQDSGEKIDLGSVGVIDFQQLYEESDEVRFTLSNEGIELPIQVEGESSRESLHLPLLLDPGRFSQLLKDDRYNGLYRRNKETVVIDNQESEPLFLRKKLLIVEASMIDDELLWWSEDQERGLEAKQLEAVDLPLYQAYKTLLNYFKARKTLPSLASWGPELVETGKALVIAYRDYLASIPTGHTLSREHRLALRLGFANLDGKEYFTPFHPLMLAYYLHLIDQIRADEENRSFRQLPAVTRSRLNPRGLIPYLYDPHQGFSYTQVVEENPFWLEVVPQQETSFDFVQQLVRQKMEEFTTTFRELFRQVEDAPLLINSVNNGGNRELFLGILDYYQTHLEKGLHIHVSLYDDEFGETEFDRFAEMGAYDEIKTRYLLDKGAARRNADTIVDLLRTRLTFSKFRNGDQPEQSYAHLTFFKNNQRVEAVPNSIERHLSGVACGGLLNGESSRSEHGRYFTAFGLKGVNCQDKPHLQLAKLVGSLMQPALSPNAIYHDHSAVSLAVSEDFRELLNRSYDSSVWTTIIDPKVTLSFFESTKGVILIHYSDQYTSSSGYDAITVTKRVDLYKHVLEEGGDNLISEFNAFNGEWLLRLVTDPAREKKAKRGIIGAYKVIACLLAQSDITWIPLSVAEMIRVAGNIGLAMSDSDFSRYNRQLRKGAISDDILFAGFKGNRLYLLPVEVKTGARPDFTKARTQTLELKRYMERDLLGNDSLESRLYRALFVRQVLLQVEKYQLYDVFAEDYFEPFLAQREFWLEGDYQLGQLDDYPEGVVVAHIEGGSCPQESYVVIDEVLQIELPMGYLDKLVKTPHRELKSIIVDKNMLHVPEAYFLKSKGGAAECEPAKVVDLSAESDQFSYAPEKIDSEAGNAPCEFDRVAETPAIYEPLRVQFGTDVIDQQPVYWEPTNTEMLFNTNTGIIGTMGTGKTQFTKSLITQIYRNQGQNVDGKPIGVLIFDYKADYVKDDFVQATDAKVFDLYHLPFNPFALFGDRPMQPVHTANLFRTTLAKAFGLGNKQQNRIRTLVMEAYEAAGISPQERSTWSRPVPTLNDVWARYQEQEKVEQDSLYAALDDLMSFEIFEPDTSKTRSLYDLVEGITVINLSGYDPQIQNLVVALTLDLFYTQMHQHGSSQLDGKYRQISKLVLVDEADNFMSQDFESLKKILKEGREFGVGTILSTQELTHFKTGDNDYSSLILSWIIHQVANIRSQEVKAIFNTQSKQDEEAYSNHIRRLEKHHSLYVDGKKNIKKIKDLAFWEML